MVSILLYVLLFITTNEEDSKLFWSGWMFLLNIINPVGNYPRSLGIPVFDSQWRQHAVWKEKKSQWNVPCLCCIGCINNILWCFYLMPIIGKISGQDIVFESMWETKYLVKYGSCRCEILNSNIFHSK